MSRPNIKKHAKKQVRRRYTMSEAALRQRRQAAIIAGLATRRGPRKQVSLREDAASILRAAAETRSISISEVVRRDVRETEIEKTRKGKR